MFQRMIDKSMAKSPWIFHINAGSCNGCDIELVSVLTPRYDAERLGFRLTGTPRQADIVVVSGSSMENTLQNGDSMLVWCLGYEPKQGDIVVLTQRSYQEDSLVKRVIATEGQRVDIDYETSTVYVDGTPLEEDYIKEAMKVPNYGEGVNHVTVPEGCIFVMGDNRNDSADSRYPSIGIIDTRSVIGRAVMVVFPFPDFNLL